MPPEPSTENVQLSVGGERRGRPPVPFVVSTTRLGQWREHRALGRVARGDVALDIGLDVDRRTVGPL